MNSEYPTSKTLLAMASPASWSVPRCPTTAVSTSTYRGSAMSVKNAGTASRRISRSRFGPMGSVTPLPGG
jgi:hypothetical protein